MAEGLKLVNGLAKVVVEKIALRKAVSKKLALSQPDIFVVVGMIILILEEDDELAQMMVDYLHKEK